MKNKFFMIALLAAAMFASCTKTETVTVTTDSGVPDVFTKLKGGTLIADKAGNTKGMFQVGTDTKGQNFAKFSSDFVTEQGTGTVTVYMSTSADFKASPGTGNPDLKLIGSISKNGEQFIKLTGAPEAKFTHVILWCGTAGVRFGYAPVN